MIGTRQKIEKLIDEAKTEEPPIRAMTAAFVRVLADDIDRLRDDPMIRFVQFQALVTEGGRELFALDDLGRIWRREYHLSLTTIKYGMSGWKEWELIATPLSEGEAK